MSVCTFTQRCLALRRLHRAGARSRARFISGPCSLRLRLRLRLRICRRLGLLARQRHRDAGRRGGVRGARVLRRKALFMEWPLKARSANRRKLRETLRLQEARTCARKGRMLAHSVVIVDEGRQDVVAGGGIGLPNSCVKAQAHHNYRPTVQPTTNMRMFRMAIATPGLLHLDFLACFRRDGVVLLVLAALFFVPGCTCVARACL